MKLKVINQPKFQFQSLLISSVLISLRVYCKGPSKAI